VERSVFSCQGLSLGLNCPCLHALGRNAVPVAGVVVAVTPRVTSCAVSCCRIRLYIEIKTRRLRRRAHPAGSAEFARVVRPEPRHCARPWRAVLGRGPVTRPASPAGAPPQPTRSIGDHAQHIPDTANVGSQPGSPSLPRCDRITGPSDVGELARDRDCAG
jgi:hypothetical protein